MGAAQLMKIYKASVIVAATHLIGVGALAKSIESSSDPQAPLMWIYFAIIDFPASLFYFIPGENYESFRNAHVGTPVAQLLYMPYIIHGLLGTLWWLFLTNFIISIYTKRREMGSGKN